MTESASTNKATIMSPFTIRPAKHSELNQLGHIFACAFWDQSLFGITMHPYRNQYPDDMALFNLRRSQVNWWDWRRHFLVATIREPRNNEEKVIGFAEWKRLGQGGSRRWSWWWQILATLMGSLAVLYNHFTSFIWPNRAASQANRDILERAWPYFEHVWSGLRAESWYLDILAVHPDYQERHCGRALVQWGLNQADTERVCASVIASSGKDGFYQKCGFDVQDGNVCEGQNNPLRDLPPGLIHWRDAKCK